MPKSLERDLNLDATIRINVDAMDGSGIFVLPGLANAGVLSPSRFPSAMSHDELAPERLGDDRPRTRSLSTIIRDTL